METLQPGVLETLLKSPDRKVVRYFTYPTGTVGSSYVHEQSPHNGVLDERVATLFSDAFYTASQALGLRMLYPDSPPDNKVAVELQVEGIEQPLYLSWYDGRQAVCFELSTDRGGMTLDLKEPLLLESFQPYYKNEKSL